LKKGPVVLSFYRGEWCPFCNLELRAYQQALPKMEALGAAFVAVSPEKPEFAQLLADKQKAHFPRSHGPLKFDRSEVWVGLPSEF
jgi:peroxiredoxin